MAYSKFWVAVVMTGANFARSYWGIDLDLDEVTAATLVQGVTAGLVYLVPNR